MSTATNTVIVSGSNILDTPGQETITINALGPTLVVTETASRSAVAVGQGFNYTVVIDNTHGTSEATAVFLDDLLSIPQINFTGSGVTTTQGSVVTSSTTHVNVDIGDIAIGSTITVIIPAIAVSV
jgi:uncharacterized repeat protein (TIGR01451 family)